MTQNVNVLYKYNENRKFKKSVSMYSLESLILYILIDKN